jgi:ammonia channel protein AmtB
MQIVGIVVCLGTGMVTAAVLSPILKATVGLRVSDDDQAKGLDVVVWDGIPPDVNSDAESA